MAYEAMLAGLEMAPFWDGINLDPNNCKDSMTPFYSLLEYTGLLINWEDHSEKRPPLLTDKGEDPLRRYSRSLVSYFLVHPISNKGYKGHGIANAPGRFMITKNYTYLFACTIRNFPRIPLHTFPIHGLINLERNTVGQMSSNGFSMKRKVGRTLQAPHPEAVEWFSLAQGHRPHLWCPTEGELSGIP